MNRRFLKNWVKLQDRFYGELNQRVCESLALGEKFIESRAAAIESGNKTDYANTSSFLGSLQPRVSSALYIEMGEFADEPSSLPHVSKRMAVQKGFCLKCFGMISWRVVFGPLK
ncbi:unnamed protein product [Brassica oleracea var. botrytis]